MKNKNNKRENRNSADLDSPSEDWYMVYMTLLAADKSNPLLRRRDMN